MRLSERIDRLLDREHRELKDAMVATGAAIGSLAAPPFRTTPLPPVRRAQTGQSEAQTSAPPRLMPHLAVLDAWAELQPPLEGHLWREERSLRLAVKVLDGDESQRTNVMSLISRLNDEHVEIRQKGAVLRAAAMRVEEVRKPVNTLLDLFEAGTRVQEIEIYPAFVAGSAEAFRLGDSPVPAHYRTPEDITSALRASRTQTPAPAREAKKPPGLVESLRRLLGV